MHSRLCGVGVLELTAQTAGDDGESFTTEILAQLEELEEAKAVRLIVVGKIALGECVMPTVLVQRTILYGTHRVLPLVAAFQVSAFDNASTGKAEDARVHVIQGLSQVLTHTVLTTLPCLNREE